MLIVTVLVWSAVGGASLALGPRCVSSFIRRVTRHLLADAALMTDIKSAVTEAAKNCDHEVAMTFWSQPMRVGFQDSLVELFMRPEFHASFATTMAKLTQDTTLKDTIREGVLEALQDEPLKTQIKAVLIEGLRDNDMRNELLQAAISTVKIGIRDAVEDTELKEVITAVIRAALEDPSLNNLMRGALKDTLADQELHRATLTGAVNALNPFKKRAHDRDDPHDDAWRLPNLHSPGNLGETFSNFPIIFGSPETGRASSGSPTPPTAFTPPPPAAPTGNRKTPSSPSCQMSRVSSASFLSTS
eukprot:TRINITY_DN9037_c1_g1_i1.p1 TRINITY_DN9037_c1_g1~~TRINITY_DN9037_c1_g1_i1.p1  ORF type:complete len:302 (-),score=58.18 TRINITY_DN9037_c1_g1_i1:63-968(-)